MRWWREKWKEVQDSREERGRGQREERKHVSGQRNLEGSHESTAARLAGDKM